MVPQAIELQLHIKTYTKQDQHEGGHFIKERTSKYQRGQQEHSTFERQIMAKENNSKGHHNKKGSNRRRKQNPKGNQNKCNK